MNEILNLSRRDFFKAGAFAGGGLVLGFYLPPFSQPAADETRSALEAPASPRWGPFTKFLVALILVVVAGAVLVRFQRMIAPLVLAVMVTYLLRPVVARMVARTYLSWHAAVARDNNTTKRMSGKPKPGFCVFGCG